MPQDFLNGAQIRTAFEQMCCRRVSQSVWPHSLDTFNRL